jgi:hypothetical protein
LEGAVKGQIGFEIRGMLKHRCSIHPPSAIF